MRRYIPMIAVRGIRPEGKFDQIIERSVATSPP